jgi:hypothetical protein
VQSKGRFTTASVAFVETVEKMKVSSESVEEKLEDQELRLEAVGSKILRRMKSDGRLEAEMKGLRLGSAAGLSTEKSAEAAPSFSTDLEDLRSGLREEIASVSGTLRTEISTLKSSCSGWLSGVFGSFQKASSICLKESAACWDFPAIFEDFKDQKFTLLWRGSRDGFGGRDFHSRCDGHPNTLTVILDTNKNIFGGFTPVAWESDRKFKADPSLKNFLFTLKNPHNVPARRFALKAERKRKPSFCNSEGGRHCDDIYVFDNCDVNTDSYAFLGCSYTNDTGLNGKTFLTGSAYFQVKEIEVFEISA